MSQLGSQRARAWPRQQLGQQMPRPFPSLALHQSPGEGGRLHPSAPRLLRGGSDSPRRQARQPPILPQDSCPPRATPRGGISTFQPQEPFQVSPRPSPSLPKHSRAQPCAFNDSAGCSAQLILQRALSRRCCDRWAQGRVPHSAQHARFTNVDYRRLHDVRGQGQILGCF